LDRNRAAPFYLCIGQACAVHRLDLEEKMMEQRLRLLAYPQYTIAK
jgi:hypothetical protein